MEFLIKRQDGDWFDLKKDQFSAAFLPAGYAATPIQGWGDYRIEIQKCEISFSYEDPGIQVCFENSNVFTEDEALKIATVIATQISELTGQKARVIQTL